MLKKDLFKTSSNILLIIFISLSITISFNSTYAHYAQERIFREIGSIGWSPDGRQIAVGVGSEICQLENVDYGIYILDSRTKQRITQFEWPECTIVSLDWSPDGSRIVSSAMGWGALVFDVASQRPVATLNRGIPVEDIVAQWSTDGTRIANFIDSFGDIAVWNPITDEVITGFESGIATTIAWRSSDQLAVATLEGIVNIWDVDKAITIETIAASTNPVTDIAWNFDSTKLAMVDTNGSARVWSVTDSEFLPFTLGTGNEYLEKVAWQPNELAFVTASDEGDIRLWNASTGELEGSWHYPGRIAALDWNPNGIEFAFGGSLRDQTLSLGVVSLVDGQMEIIRLD
jgi:WD40 repeat protein